MQLLLTHPHLRLYLLEGPCQAIEAQWKGFVGSALLRQTTLECVALAREHHATGWVADDRLLGPVRPQDLAWIAATVLPGLVEAGLQRFARLEAEDPLNQFLIGQAQATAEQQLPFALRSFTDVEQARRWACGAPGS
jgi:hypothetical protein